MSRKKYYKLWLHVEEVKTDKDGNDRDFMSLDDEFLPIQLASCKTKPAVTRTINAIEQFEKAIALLIAVRFDSCMESDYDQEIHEFLKCIRRLPKGCKPYWT